LSISNDKKLNINYEAMKRLDYVLFYAAKYNIKVIMVPVNFEPSFGGMQWWVDQIKGAGHAHVNFYTDSKVQAIYKQYLSILANRVNSINGVQFKNDPTILAWDTANEPHTKDGVDYTGKIVAQWVCNIAQYMSETLGLKQMITSGEEGYQTNGYLGGANRGHEWVQNGLKGVDFATNVQCKFLSYSTVHLYPDNWNIHPNEFKNYINEFLAERVALTKKYGKPLVVEEFGCCLAQPYKGRRLEIFGYYLEAFRSHAVAGQLVWQMFPAGSPLLRDSENYDFTPSTDYQSAIVLINENKRLNGWK
jgi:mannan endo-1,4-beta-mannosidase